MMRVAFDISRPRSLTDWVIAIFTGSNCTHCELVFSNGESFSSSPHDDGTRFAKINFDDPKKWEVISLPWISVNKEAEIKKFCKSELDCRYDWGAVLLGWLITPAGSTNKWFCTEIVHAAIRHSLKHVVDRWYTPAALKTALYMEQSARS